MYELCHISLDLEIYLSLLLVVLLLFVIVLLLVWTIWWASREYFRIFISTLGNCRFHAVRNASACSYTSYGIRALIMYWLIKRG